jgi:hypothetical protein
MSATESIDVFGVVNPDQIALEISRYYDKWKVDKNRWESNTKELRDYLYAVDTSTTTNSVNPFFNRTTVPKLMQIAQNLHANYFQHMFSNDKWISWEAHNHESALEEKRRTVESYIRTKARQQDLVKVFGELLWDWILYGNCFSQMIYVNETKIDSVTGETIQGYVGPKLVRISPYDIVFNAGASEFKKAPTIQRTVHSLGNLARMIEERPDLSWPEDVMSDIINTRKFIRDNHQAISNAELDKTAGLAADGFATIQEYYNSDLVEILTFTGDFYDGDKDILHKDHEIVVLDRRIVLSMKPVDSWTGSSYIYHDGWAGRPDNLYGMGPLDNLVGMQYKIDKLENLRADVFDQIAHPTTVEVGTVEFFGQRGAPGGRYVAEEGGSVGYLNPDSTALQADFQIQQTMRDMEELAGSPREAMGIRSPGEKTAFEVQTLDNAANRLFRHKVNQFESNVVEPVLNDMLEMARRNLNGSDLIRSVDATFGIEEFLSVTKEDLTAAGKLYALGSKHFIADSNMMQNINTIFSSPVSQFISPHISKTELARTVESLLGLQEFSLVQENIGILEDIESQRIAQTGQQALEEEAQTDVSQVGGGEPIEEELPL